MNEDILAAAQRGRDFLRSGGFALEAAAVDHAWFAAIRGLWSTGSARTRTTTAGLGGA